MEEEEEGMGRGEKEYSIRAGDDDLPVFISCG
jgi:hypothetical protein